GTTFASVRFGNVLGSHGSVIPLFKEQIQRRADVTVTHPEIIRYFMTIPEASQLVLTAGAMAKGGEIFVLDMGKPVKISDLAHKMISLAGLTEGKDIHIRYVGLRPGEKLFEELLMDEEGLKKTASDRIFIGKPIDMDYGLFMDRLDSMHKLVQRADVTGKEVEDALLEFVPTFKRYVPPEIEFCSNN
ncbi:MAG: polysaccharide biosynthesis protein, partial [Clostridia bacterium]|nr:polysaccharide biosynthesis protein [Clostridia bacterium]